MYITECRFNGQYNQISYQLTARTKEKKNPKSTVALLSSPVDHRSQNVLVNFHLFEGVVWTGT